LDVGIKTPEMFSYISSTEWRSGKGILTLRTTV